MAISDETLRLAEELRITVAAAVDDQVRTLVVAWARAWDEISSVLKEAIADIIAIGADGKWATRGQIARVERASKALFIVGEALDALAQTAGVSITGTIGPIVAVSAAAQVQIVLSQLPPAAVRATQPTVTVSWSRVDARALEAIVARSTEQITSLLRPLSPDATAAMQRSLIRGVAIGDSPERAAARMLRRVEGDFNGGLTRALTIARTEMLDANREAARVLQDENGDVLTGWIWTASLNARTCPACLAKHGSVHPIHEPGPWGHPNCRCSRTPKTKSWADLGFEDLDEPEDQVPSAEEWFWALPEPEQVQIMGPGRMAALRSGRIAWEDLATLRHNDGWRDSWQVTPLIDLLAA